MSEKNNEAIINILQNLLLVTRKQPHPKFNNHPYTVFGNYKYTTFGK